MFSIQYEGNRCQFLTKTGKIKEKHWNKNQQRVNAGNPNRMDINALLDKYEEVSKKIIYENKVDGYLPKKDELKKMIFDRIEGKKNSKNLIEFIDEFIENRKNICAKSTITDYKYTKNELIKFQDYSKKKVDFDTINMDFYDDFLNFQINHCNVSLSTFGKRIKILKTFMNASKERELHKNIAFQQKSFKVLSTTTDSIFLDKEDIGKVSKVKLKSKLDIARDLFLVGCLTGLRFGDYSKIKKENIIKHKDKDVLSFISEKNNKKIEISIHHRLYKILKKYNYKLPSMSNSSLNLLIKEVGKIAGINKEIELTKYTKGKKVITKVRKYSQIQTHTARRSFATNLYINNVPIQEIMKMTGHKKESTFLRYIKITRDLDLKSIEEFILPVEENLKVI